LILEQNKAYDFSSDFYDFAFMPKFDENIIFLSGMVEKEDWDYQNTQVSQNNPILSNYIKYTYRRIAEEKK
jgi:hypothetical protein